MDDKKIVYGITLKTVCLKNEENDKEISIRGGKMVQNCENFIRVFNVKQKNLECSSDVLKIESIDFSNKIGVIEERLWLILLAINDDTSRLKIMRSKKFCDFLTVLDKGSRVSISGHLFDRDEDIICVVGYVGPVPEIGPGIFYGFMVGVHDQVPVQNHFPYKYMKCANSRGFFRAADCLLDTIPLKDRFSSSGPLLLSNPPSSNKQKIMSKKNHNSINFVEVLPNQNNFEIKHDENISGTFGVEQIRAQIKDLRMQICELKELFLNLESKCNRLISTNVSKKQENDSVDLLLLDF